MKGALVLGCTCKPSSFEGVTLEFLILVVQQVMWQTCRFCSVVTMVDAGRRGSSFMIF
jgi:hypothetical protein